MSTPAADRPLRIVVVDDHPVVRDGLRGMIDGQPDLVVVGEAGDGNEPWPSSSRNIPTWC